MTNLNELSDEALRLALARALERNAHLEGLISSIVKRVKRLDDMKLEWMSAERYAKLAYEAYQGDGDAYLEAQKWVLEEREKQEEGEEPYPYEHECPFFSERFLYCIFGKEDARTILAYFHEIQRLAEEDDSEMRRRRERQEEQVREARTIAFYKEKAERLRRALSTDDKDKWCKLPKSMDESEARAKLEEYNANIIRMSEHLADSIIWHAEDN